MSFTVHVQDEEFRAWISRAPTEIKQAALDGLNRTQEEALIAGKDEVIRNFVQRDKSFISTMPTGKHGAPIPRHWRAKLGASDNALVAIGDGGARGKLGQNRLNILEPFEEGKLKQAHSMPVAIPTRALRPDFRAAIPKALHPRYLLGQYNLDGQLTGLKAGKNKRTTLGPRRARSLYSYYLMPKHAGKSWGIWERTPSGSRMVWAFRDSIKRPKLLNWRTTTSAVAQRRIALNVAGMVGSAIRKFDAKFEGWKVERFYK